MLTLRQLRYLDALARHRHFGRAAEECAVSQPALSMQIHELEECLGGGLVERRQGEAVLTSRGLAIADRAATDCDRLAEQGSAEAFFNALAREWPACRLRPNGGGWDLEAPVAPLSGALRIAVEHRSRAGQRECEAQRTEA